MYPVYDYNALLHRFLLKFADSIVETIDFSVALCYNDPAKQFL